MKTLRALYVALSLLTISPAAFADTQPDAPRVEHKEGTRGDPKGTRKHDQRGSGELQKRDGQRPQGTTAGKHARGPQGECKGKGDGKGEFHHHLGKVKKGQFHKGERPRPEKREGQRGKDGSAPRR